MKTGLLGLIGGVALVAATPAEAETIGPGLADQFMSEASHCTGEWQVHTIDSYKIRTAADHLPERGWFDTGRDALDYDRARSIYDFANAMLAPAFESEPGGVFDASPMIDCTPNAGLGLTVMEWLAGANREDLRGPSNVYSWIAASYQHGIGTAVDPETARRYWLRAHITFGLPGPEFWGDGINDDPYGNVERAGLLDFLMADAANKFGDAARRILAQHFISSDPERARSLLSDIHLLSGRLRLEFEDAGRLASSINDDELEYWLAMSRRYPMNATWRAKALGIVAEINGGTIPIHSKRIELHEVFADAAPTSIDRGGLDQTPIGLRALVDKEGTAVMIDICDWTGETKYSTDWRSSPALREAWGLFSKSELAPLPRPLGAAQYGWVSLPVISFSPGKNTAILVEVERQPDCTANPVREMPTAH